MTMTDDASVDASRVIASQRAFFDGGGTRGTEMRIAVLRRLEQALRDRRDTMLAALAEDLGKPPIEAFLAEHRFLLDEIRLICASLERWLKPRRAGNPFYFWPCRSSVRREPFGAVLVMAPWNYPIQLSLSPLVAAVAAGNTVVLKPSEHAQASERFLAEVIADCFPPEHVAVITGGPEVAESLLDRAFDFIFFTGSSEIGKQVARKAAEHLTPTVLELGGKCPCVVDKSADLPATARRILTGKLFNAGQTCMAPDFVAAHEDIRQPLVEELTAALNSLPWEQEMARVINERHYKRLRGLLTGREIRKGEDHDEALHFAPRILPDAGWDDPAMNEEVFGPILPVVGFTDREDLIARLRGLPSPLALYAFSRDEDFIQALTEGIRSGSLCVNDTLKQACNLNLPFGGVGASGHGRYRGKAGVMAFSYERAVTRRFFLPDPFDLSPPRAEMARFLMKWLG